MQAEPLSAEIMGHLGLTPASPLEMTVSLGQLPKPGQS